MYKLKLYINFVPTNKEIEIMSTIIENIKKNSMGTISFDMKAKGMRKPQDFITYPIGEKTNLIHCQSDKKWIEINTETKKAKISVKGNTYWHFGMGSIDLDLTAEQIEELVEAIKKTSAKKAGSNGIVYCDNSGAGLL